MGRQMVDALQRNSQGRGDRPSRGQAERHGYQDQPRCVRQGDRRRLCRQGRQTAGTEGPHRRRGRKFDREPRLLLNSASSQFPDGLANSSGQVGKNYMRHTTGSVYGIFDKPVHMYRGTTMAGIIRDEARNDPSRGFVGGYELETLSLGLPFMAAFLNPGGWGRSFTTALDHYDHMAGMWIVGEDMPREQKPHHAACRSQGRARHGGSGRPFRRPCQRHGNARPRLQAGLGALRSGGCDPDLPDATLSVDPQSRHQPDERRRPTASSTSMARRTTSRTCSCRMAASSPPAALKTQH